VGDVAAPRGAKTELILDAIARQPGPFRVSDILHDCPSVSLDMIRSVLKDLRTKGQVECLGRGQYAQWARTPEFQIGNAELIR